MNNWDKTTTTPWWNIGFSKFVNPFDFNVVYNINPGMKTEESKEFDNVVADVTDSYKEISSEKEVEDDNE